jgi:hypothetical protein
VLKKKIIEYILISSLSGLLVTGVALGAVVISDQNKFENEVKFSDTGTTSEALGVNLGTLYPSKSVEYSATFSSDVTQVYTVTLAFYADSEVVLANYVNATMEINGDEVSSGVLNEYLEGKIVEVDLPMTSDNNATFTLRCTMPTEVGDEAQNLSADFTMEITASPKE